MQNRRVSPLRNALLQFGVLATGLLLLGSIMGEPSARAITPASTSTPPEPSSVSAVPYSGGRAFVSWSPGNGATSESYRVEEFSVSSSGSQAVSTLQAYGTSVVADGLQPGTSYLFSVNAVNSAGSGPTSNSGLIQAVGAATPPAPTGVRLALTGADNQLTLTWTPSTYPVAAEIYTIGVFEGAGSSPKQVGAVSCDAPCTSMVLQARPGSVTTALVNATNPVGTSNAWSNSVSVPQTCPLACVTVATENPGSSFGHQADGFLDPAGPADPRGLEPEQWRTNYRTLDQLPVSTVAHLGGASLTDVLSDDWVATHNLAGYAITPWTDWSVYSQFITSDVKRVEALGTLRGFKITYWEVQNEPFGGHYYSPSSSPPPSETVSNFEKQFLVAYQAIKAADSHALVVGPSLMAWNAEKGDTPSVGIDMRSFLDFCAEEGIQLGAVSFHADNFFAEYGWYAPDGSPAQPAQIQLQVSELRDMLAARPSVGDPAILVNEYGDPYTSELPGWSVGWIAALSQAGVTGAGRSCWNDCGSALDGLLASNGAPLPSYWVYSFYASMTGRSVPVTSSYTGVTGIAAVGGNATISALLGRHQNCTRAVDWRCPSLPAEPLSLEIQVPNATAATVTMAVIPMGLTSSSPLNKLSPSTISVPVTNGVAGVTTPALQDGDAIEVTITPVG